MADRSTAAVDMADGSGATLNGAADTDHTPEANVDGSEQSGREPHTDPEAAPRADGDGSPPQEPPEPPGDDGEPEQDPTTRPAPELHSGHKLADRYRLEECLTRSEDFSSWRAVDEMLRRAVGVHVLPSWHDRAKRVLAAARSAALVADPRFVQVLDAVEDDELCYVVHEWLPDAVELTTLLAEGPLPPHQADRMVRQLSDAMATAHREGLAHLMLTPHTVLCTEDGQFHVRGLAVAAALHGRESDQPAAEDTRAIGALLYAALTHRWPSPQDAYGLSGLPDDLGLVPPDQVRAGVHRGLAELAMRALVNDGATAASQEPPYVTPAELARAAAATPKIRPPEPEFPDYEQGGYRATAYRKGGYRQPPSRTPVAAPPQPVPPPPPPPALPGRAGKALKWIVALLLTVALGLGSWQITEALFNGGGGDRGDDAAPSPSTSGQSVTAKPVPLDVEGAEAYSAEDGPDNAEDVHLTHDGDPGSYWRTKYYLDGPEVKLVKGLGVVYDLGEERKLSTASVRLLYGGDHTTVHLYAADSPSQLLSGMKKIGTKTTDGSSVEFSAAKPVSTRYVLVWMTALPYRAPDNNYRQGITEVSFTGLKQ
ncbi:serine/threonine protein kinase [Wenjunlia vitaminophila]|uniref:Serine/threonine protein kinase n=1 Tax=Wenjunlia vitaminophila TaxID=76728 RepID=A0A0T6LN81_WENVI|nr:protein kinase family protein [Wenjunlia vitaminophila]KRV47308.1 serine/threonine protein kinase [Wenjunlia vitaminophila]